jgi:predicted acetyltransferase
MIFLTEPHAQYKDSFIEGLHEFQQEGRMQQYNLEQTRTDFAGFVRGLHTHKNAASLPPHLVPWTDFWLIDGEEFIGHLTLRHTLNEFLLKIGGHIGYLIRPSKRHTGYGTLQLKLGLEKARTMGLTRVLITCDENNIASKKVIERNGGQFEKRLLVEGFSIPKLHYWIDLASTRPTTATEP